MLGNLPRFLIENLDVFSSFTQALNSTLNVGKGNRKKSTYVGKEKRQKSTYVRKEKRQKSTYVGKEKRQKSTYVGKEKRQKSTYLTFWTAKGLFKVLLINSFEFFHCYNNLSFG